MILFAAGLNGHGQLKSGNIPELSSDIVRFESIAEGDDVQVLLAKWSFTILRQSDEITLLGYHRDQPGKELSLEIEDDMHTIFDCGNPPESIGFTSPDGDLYMEYKISSNNGLKPELDFMLFGHGSNPALLFMAFTATGHTCVSTISEPPSSQYTELSQFKSFSSFHSWFEDLTNSNRENEDYIHHSIRGCIAQLEAGAAHFILRTEEGDLYSWTTDARHHRCLGRAVSAEVLATTPSPIEALGGIAIAKVAVGDWMTIALSRDRDAYVWGRERPQAERQTINALPGPQEDVKLVDVAGGADIADVAAGSGHLLVLTVDGALFAIGDNYNGQLSLEHEEQDKCSHVEDWTEVMTLKGKTVKRIWAGDCTSFALTE